MKLRNAFFIAIVLSVFLVGISAISADDDTFFGSKTFTIGEMKFTAPSDANVANGNNSAASFSKNGYVCEVKKISDDEHSKYKKWIDTKMNDNNVPVERQSHEKLFDIYKTKDNNNNTILFFMFKQNFEKCFAQIHGDANHNNVGEMDEIIRDFISNNSFTDIEN